MVSKASQSWKSIATFTNLSHPVFKFGMVVHPTIAALSDAQKYHMCRAAKNSLGFLEWVVLHRSRICCFVVIELFPTNSTRLIASSICRSFWKVSANTLQPWLHSLLSRMPTVDSVTLKISNQWHAYFVHKVIECSQPFPWCLVRLEMSSNDVCIIGTPHNGFHIRRRGHL